MLVPKSARLIPTAETRAFHRKRNATYTVDRFETYNDWFYFIHVDPYTRWVHAIGMMIGSSLYILSAYHAWIFGFTMSLIVQIFSGMFFFFFLPLLSHYFYDGGDAKSESKTLHSTFIPVIHINLMTLTGTYDRWLRKFIEKYPFTVEAWELEERNND